jgi:predicted RNA-binding Zn ribbon-like protein
MGDAADAVFGRLIGGRPSLDFVNTVGGRAGGGSRGAARRAHAVIDERLTSYDALLGWGVLSGSLARAEAAALDRQAAAHPRRAAAVLRRALELREALYHTFTAALEGAAPRGADLSVLNAELAVARSHERLAATPEFGWAWDRDAGALDRPLWPVATDAAELLVSGDPSRLGRCPAPDCGWLFLDTSRSGRRQWCDMATCGNVAKVRRFRARRGGAG